MVRVINFRGFSSFCLRFGPPGNHLKMILRGSEQNKNLRSFQVFFSERDPPENRVNMTVRTCLEPWGPRDRPWIQERKILFRIALTRALYDQMAPQLCPFYVPGSGPPG